MDIIGIRNEFLQAEALEAAGKISQVVVDHGQTGCMTADVAGYIQKTMEGKQERHKVS